MALQLSTGQFNLQPSQEARQAISISGNSCTAPLQVSKGCPRPKPTPPTPHLLLLPFPFGLALFQLLGLLLGKAHGLCREEILEAFKATVVFFCRGWKGERSPSVLGRTRDTEAEAGSKPPYHPDPTTPDRGHVATVLGQLTTVMSTLVTATL